MRRLKTSNSLIIIGFIVLSPIYPVFGAVLYDGTRNGFWGSIDETSILAEYTDVTDRDYIAPEVVSDDDSRTTIEEYVIQNWDTIGNLSEKFRISSNSLRWANNLSSNTLRIGQKLIIPPGDGILYTTKQGDTLDAIALKFKTTSEKVRTANFLWEILPTGVTLFLPDAQQPSITISSDVDEVQRPFTLRVINPSGAGFVPWHCTYFVAKYWPVKWRGHARYWYKNASAAGFKTGQTAKPGAIVVWYGPGYNLTYGHVGIVMSVDKKAGTMVIKDMNYAWLWKVTTRVEKLKNKYIIGYIYNEKK